MRIFLIGMPGSGKSTLGRRLAKELQLLFVDLDKEIEKREGKSVQQIFAEHGEDYFRQVESQMLIEWAGSSGSFVMATGGGTPCFYNGIDTINQSGLSVFLDVSVKELLSRVEEKNDRPLLQSADAQEMEIKLKAIHERRFSCYRRAMLTVTDPNIDKLVTAIRVKM